jgi:magnesium transporter
MANVRSEARLQASVADIRRLLDRHRLLDTLAARQDDRKRDLLEDLQHRQNIAELQRHVRGMHIADVAYALEALPLDDRRRVWEQVDEKQAARVFVEVDGVVRQSLVDAIAPDAMVRLLASLDPEDLAYVSDAVPAELLAQASAVLESADRMVFEDSRHFQPDTVGYFMTREWVAIPETHTVEMAIHDLRARGDLPPQTDRIFVVDARSIVVGSVPLQALLVRAPDAPILQAMTADTPTFGPLDPAADAVKSFARYDLISAPVVDDRGKIVGRLTVDAAMDVMREQADLQALRSAGLREDEDLFAAPLDSARNRWPWLGVNLGTAFIASRVIGQFEATISGLAPLAALLPIVASIGGNTGNQTMAVVMRGLAGDRIRPSEAARLMRKELAVSLLNGTAWGLMVGLFAYAFYASAGLGVVMTAAVVLNLVVAAVTGVFVPLLLHAAGRDPAQGASVLLTFVTDAMGFFLLLGLARVFLL